MGDRANYAIRENERVELYYSHWGASSIAEDIFWGPTKTEAFIRKNQTTDEWLDEVWAQGGIALDKDRRRLTYYYFEWPDEEDIRRVYETLLEDTWRASAWSVVRVLEWRDFAAEVGVDPSLVTAKATAPNTITFDDLGKNLQRSFCCGLLSVRTDHGWQDRAIDFSMSGFLMNGPALISRLSTVADLAELRAAFLRRREDDPAKTLGDWLDEFCAIDVVARSIRISVPDHEERGLPLFREVWRGWQVLDESGGALEHFAHTGREAPSDFVPTPKPPPLVPPERSYEECVHLILDHIGKAEDQKSAAQAGHIQLVEKLRANGGPVIVAPGFFDRVPSSGPSLIERLEMELRHKSKKPTT